MFKDYERVATLPIGSGQIERKNKNLLIMFGSEADGLSQELKGFATSSLTIKTTGEVESLNLSISAGIIFHQIYNY